jgi:hypothetical protein
LHLFTTANIYYVQDNFTHYTHDSVISVVMLSFPAVGSGLNPLTLPSLEGHVFSGVVQLSLLEGGPCMKME